MSIQTGKIMLTTKSDKQYQEELKKLGIDWKPPTAEEIKCAHKWNAPEKKGRTRQCVKCGGKQSN